MSALVRLRIGAFLRSGRAIAPILGGLAAIALAYGGGAAPAAEARSSRRESFTTAGGAVRSRRPG